MRECQTSWSQYSEPHVLSICLSGICLLKVNNRNTRVSCEICSKLIKTQERGHWRHSGVFIVNFENISHLVLVFQLLTFNIHLSSERNFLGFSCHKKINLNKISGKSEMVTMDPWLTEVKNSTLFSNTHPPHGCFIQGWFFWLSWLQWRNVEIFLNLNRGTYEIHLRNSFRQSSRS